jgi:acyl-CoA synthetase (AMP-forming)/AMP-acid ligase II
MAPATVSARSVHGPNSAFDPGFDAGGLTWDAWRRHAERAPDAEAIVHLSADQPARRWRWGPLMEAASSAARWLAERGVKPGEVCALIVRHHPDFYPLYLGVSALGALPAVLAYPNARLHPEKFREGLRGMARRSGLDHVLTERALAPLVEPLVVGEGSSIRDVLFPMDPGAGAFDTAGPLALHPPSASEDPCLLQHSSGTTGLQKPVVLSHRAVLDQVRRYGEAIGLGPDDRIVSWLPLYHDMGLIAAFYLPLVHGVPLVQLSPLEWVATPSLLTSALSSEGGTLCWLPNFSYAFMAERIRDEDLAGVRLDSVRLLVNCSEPVRAESHDRFANRFATWGLRRSALGACYAMAETTFAVTQTPPGQEATQLLVDRAELAQGRVRVVEGDGPAARRCVSSGTLVSGSQLRVLSDDGQPLPAGRVGELVIASTALFDGYRNYPEKTAEVLADGWFRSGDQGFLHEGSCYVVGRTKDLIIVAGNNVFPEDVEDAVARVPGVLPGRVVAFGVEDERLGTEALCVVAEASTSSDPERRALRLAIMQAGLAIDTTISRVYLVEPRWLIKSSSGKPARATNRARALDGIAFR